MHLPTLSSLRVADSVLLNLIVTTTVKESRRRIAAARTVFWRGDRATRLCVGLGVTILMVLILVMPFGTCSPRGVSGADPDGTADEVRSVAVPNLEETHAAPPVPVDRPDPTPTGGMTNKLDLDLQTDPSNECQVKGPVTWKPGRLTIGSAGSISRALDAGAQAKLTLRLEFTPLVEDGQTSTTRFAFQIRDRGEVVVLIVRRREKSKTVGELRLIDQDTPYVSASQPTGMLVKMTRTLRTFAWENDFPEGPWTFRLHHGLLTVYRGNKQMAAAYADKEPKALANPYEYQIFPKLRPAYLTFWEKFAVGEPLEAAGWSLQQEGTPIACLAISGNASPSYRNDMKGLGLPVINGKPLYNQKENLRLRIALPIAYYQENLHVNAQDDDTPLVNIRAWLGKRHPYEALALEGLGMQLHWGGISADAEQLLKLAIAISEESLGPLHPDHASRLSSLGKIYREIGRLDRAEPLLVQARQTAREVFGAHSGRYAMATCELALLYQDTGRVAEAETILRRAAEVDKDALLLDRAEALPTLLLLAEIQARMGEIDKAEGLLQQARQAMGDLFKAGETPLPPETWQQCEHRIRITKTLNVDLAKAQAGIARKRFHDGQHDEARKLARSAFLNVVEFYRVQGGTLHFDTRFQGWDSQMTNVQVPSALTNHPAFGRTMTALAELFIDLGDQVPALRCIEVTDRLYGLVNRDLAVLCRIMGKLCEAHPDINADLRALRTYFYKPTLERKQLEIDYPNFNKQTGLTPDVYWRQLALEKFEKFAGREHPDTIDMLQALARGQWRSGGPEKAESTLRDACNRAVDLSDRVVAGLPEAQAYQFLEANRPPTDLLLSCFRATSMALSPDGKPGLTTGGGRDQTITKTDPARDAYETIWRSNALATRQLMERRQLLQAASERPELIRLANDLQTTRQRLAWFSLSAPLEQAAERNRQLAELTDRKEDLERELAKLSEPFRRTRDAGRTSVADMVRRLPARTAVVHFVERWQWTRPVDSGPLPVSSIGKGEKQRDALLVGSYWKGEKRIGNANPATLKITERDGTRFKGEFTCDQFDQHNVDEVAGTISDGKIEWRTTKVLQGIGPNGRLPTTGTVKENAIDAKFTFARMSKTKTISTETGTINLTESDPPAKALELSEPGGQTRCYDAFVLRSAHGEPGWSATWLALGDADALDRLLEGWITSLGSKRRAAPGVADQLRRGLWAPLEASLADCQMVILVPDGRLAQMPWAALPGRKLDSYLVEDYALVQAPYGQYVARLLMDPAPTGDGFLAVGGIDYGPGGKWSYLKGTADEVEQLQALRPGVATVSLSGEAASKPRLQELLPGRRYVHLATHGEFLDPGPGRDGGRSQARDSATGGDLFDVSARNPLLLSMLVLAGANRPARTDGQGLPVGSDSFLTAEEVMGMDLTRTELVVLSACETGLGKIRGGEGVFSLQRAFHIGGSRAVVSSLWQIPDKATQVLMRRFYENLWRKQMSKLDALRDTQLWMLREGTKQPELQRGLVQLPDGPETADGRLPPYYWAAFVLSGDWR